MGGDRHAAARRIPDAAWPEGTVIETLDLAKPGSAAALAERVIAVHGCPDVLLNNAGTLQWGPVECASARARSSRCSK